jgi:hypothetical protein
VEKLIKQVGTKDAMVNKISEKFPHNLDSRSHQFETKDIIDVIHQMKNSRSSGHDGISMTYIKDCAAELAPVLKFIYDKVSLFATMPNQWKLAKIIPLHKKDKKENPENYRPISLLCSLGKVYEKCLLNVMTKKFGESLPSSFQHGFRKNHSTSTAALTVQNIIAKALDNKKKVIVILTDMSAAFDLLDITCEVIIYIDSEMSILEKEEYEMCAKIVGYKTDILEKKKPKRKRKETKKGHSKHASYSKLGNNS